MTFTFLRCLTLSICAGLASLSSSCSAQTCDKIFTLNTALPKPTLQTFTLQSKFIEGKVAGKFPSGAQVRLCVTHSDNTDTANDGASAPPVVSIGANGSFSFALSEIKAGDSVVAQVVSPDAPASYGPESAAVKIEPTPSAEYDNPPSVLFIGGVEQSGFSSLATSTEPFIQLHLIGPLHHIGQRRAVFYQPWGHIRLLGAPQPSTNGIASTFTDPTGAITKLDFTKVGQSLDLVAGPQVYLTPVTERHGAVSFIAFAGTTTTLSSQSVAYTFKTPALGTTECQALLKRFTPQNGYTPGLQADPAGKACVANGSTAVTDIAFANQDRTNFLFKWGAGFRGEGTLTCKKSRAECSDAMSLLDVTVGQDAAITRGMVRHFVAKADGLLAIPTGKDTQFLYLFGSIYTRLTRNQNSAPLILAAETSQPSLPNPAVIVLPLIQPDRDFFRLGVGLNLTQIMKKFFSSGDEGK